MKLRRACSVSDCPWPYEPSLHYCWAREVEGHFCYGKVTHQHKPRKGMGGNNPLSKIRAMLCAGLHSAIDNHHRYFDGKRYSDEYKDGEYRLFREGVLVRSWTLEGVGAASIPI